MYFSFNNSQLTYNILLFYQECLHFTDSPSDHHRHPDLVDSDENSEPNFPTKSVPNTAQFTSICAGDLILITAVH